MIDYKDIESIAKSNYVSYNVLDEDKWHQEVGNVLKKEVERCLRKYSSEKCLILNAGSGGEEYNSKGNFIHLDIVEDNISKFENHIVASVTDIPLSNNSVDIIICVGSVLNYVDLSKTLSEFKRILKNKGILILEFERTKSADFWFNQIYNKNEAITFYEYNNQKHKMIMYGEKYVKEQLHKNCFYINKTRRFHIASTIACKLGANENKCYKLINFDWIFYPISYWAAHNCLLICKKG